MPVKTKPRAINQQTKIIKLFAGAAVIVVLAFTLIYQLIDPYNQNDQSIEVNTLNVSEILPLTATDQFEYYSRYSPNGQYIAFLRAETTASLSYKTLWHVWIKNLTTDAEYQLTPKAGKINSFSWSIDSKAILYATRNDETVNVYRLMNKPSQRKQPVTNVLTRTDIQRMTAIHWGVNNHLFYIAKINGISTLFANNLTNGEQKTILTSNDDFYPYELSLSYQGERIAVLGFNKKRHSQVKIISLTADGVPSDKPLPITLATLDSNRYFISWHPNNKTILLSDGRHLFNLNSHGQVNKIGFENFTFVRHPQFSPDGNKIALTLENIDEDIWLHDIQKPETKRLLVNSNTSDFEPRFSPSGTKFTFISTRKGYPQLYIHDVVSGKNRLVFANPKQNLSVYPAIWHPSGKMIASATNEQPFIINLTDDDFTVEMLTYTQGIPLQWYRHENALLVSHQQGSIRILAKLDLKRQQLSTLRTKDKNSAYLNHNDELLLSSKNTITNTLTNNKVTLLASDTIQRSFLANNGIYLTVTTGEKRALYFFSYVQETLQEVSVLGSTQNISTVSQSVQSLLTATQRIEKDIVILTLGAHDLLKANKE